MGDAFSSFPVEEACLYPAGEHETRHGAYTLLHMATLSNPAVECICISIHGNIKQPRYAV